MKEYYVHYNQESGKETFSVTNKEEELVIFPGSGPTEFICTIVEELLLEEKGTVKIILDKNLPDYYARAIELYKKFYNLIPDERKPIGDYNENY